LGGSRSFFQRHYLATVADRRYSLIRDVLTPAAKLPRIKASFGAGVLVRGPLRPALLAGCGAGVDAVLLTLDASHPGILSGLAGGEQGGCKKEDR
jgi:hypothetical protein